LLTTWTIGGRTGRKPVWLVREECRERKRIEKAERKRREEKEETP